MYEKLIEVAEKEGLYIVETKLSKRIKGLYCDGVIAINKDMSIKEKTCTICEELGHYHNNYGDILDQSDIRNRKQERLARTWGYEKLVGVVDIINAYNEGVRNRYELAEYLSVTEDFVDESIKYYKEKYGLFYEVDKYIVYFDPLGVLEIFF